MVASFSPFKQHRKSTSDPKLQKKDASTELLIRSTVNVEKSRNENRGNRAPSKKKVHLIFNLYHQIKAEAMEAA